MRQFHFRESEQGKRKYAHPSDTCAMGGFERILALTSEELVPTSGTISFYLYDLRQTNFLNSSFLL